MQALLTKYRSRGDVQPMVGLAAAAAEEYDAPLATGVMPIGGWR